MRQVSSVIVASASLVWVATASAEPLPVRIDSPAHLEGLEKLAVNELESYFRRIFTNPLTADKASDTILIGTPKTHAGIADLLKSGRIALPHGPNKDQGYCLKRLDSTLVIAGSSPAGVLHGVYGYLEECGVVFQISGERLPPPAEFSRKPLDISVAPVFRYRGLLPWDNFLCGISGYDLADYRVLIDRAARLRLNMLQFHFYPGMAFFTEEWDGQPVDPTVIGMPVDSFRTSGAVGEAAFGGEAVFGCDPYLANAGKPRAQAEAVQDMMRQVIDYAHSRGLVTCVGFELMVPVGGGATMTDKPQEGDGGLNLLDPLREHNVDLSVKRLRTLMKTYPNSDYYWLWQSEARGYLSRFVGREAGAAQMRETHARWAGNPGLAGDIDYAYLFREVVRRLAPEERSRLATGGWSIEHLFPAFHQDCPSETIFASLNGYTLRAALRDQVPMYRVAGQGRRDWMIEWWEFDGNQWFPQFRASWQDLMYRHCREFGVESVTLLGWKLSGIEHNVRYLSQYSWNPGLDAKAFYRSHVRQLYGEAAAPLAELLMEYDLLEPDGPPANPADDREMLLSAGWMPLAIPSFPTSLSALDTEPWRTTVRRAPQIVCSQQRLRERDRQSAAQIRALLPALDEQGSAWAGMLSNRLEFRSIYLDSMIALNGAFPDFDAAAREKGLQDARQAAAGHVRRAVELSRQAIETYARVVRNTEDKGVVAQMNEQYYKPLRSCLQSLD